MLVLVRLTQNPQLMKKYCLYAVLLFLAACKNDPETRPQKESGQHFVPHNKMVVQQTYHADTTCKYEHRTGTSEEYQYSYDVLGSDGNGEEVTGTITVQDKYGKGTLTDTKGNEIAVETEWIGHGKLKATDKEGNNYELKVE